MNMVQVDSYVGYHGSLFSFYSMQVVKVGSVLSGSLSFLSPNW